MPLPLNGTAPRGGSAPRRRARFLLPMAALLLALMAACDQTQRDGPLDSQAGVQPLGFDVAAVISELRSPASEDSTSALLAELPAPTGRSVVPVANRHVRGQTDRIINLHYPGVDIEVYQLGDTSRELLKSVRVSRTDVEFEGVRVGQAADLARQAVGAAPVAEGPGSEAYLLGEFAPSTLVLEWEDGVLAAFTLHGYLD